MTIEQLIERLADYPLAVAGVMLAVPVLAWLLVLTHGAGRGDLKPWRYVHSILLHLAVFPGVFALLLLGYQLFMRPGDLLALNLLVYVLPPVCMGVSLMGIRRATAFEHLPGSGRLRGFVVTAGLSFALCLLVMKFRVGLFFFSSIWMFLILVAILYALLRGGLRAMTRGRRRPPPGGPR